MRHLCYEIDLRVCLIKSKKKDGAPLRSPNCTCSLQVLQDRIQIHFNEFILSCWSITTQVTESLTIPGYRTAFYITVRWTYTQHAVSAIIGESGSGNSPIDDFAIWSV